MSLCWGSTTCAIDVHVVHEKYGGVHETGKINIAGGRTGRPPFLWVSCKEKLAFPCRAARRNSGANHPRKATRSPPPAPRRSTGALDAAVRASSSWPTTLTEQSRLFPEGHCAEVRVITAGEPGNLKAGAVR